MCECVCACIHPTPYTLNDFWPWHLEEEEEEKEEEEEEEEGENASNKQTFTEEKEEEKKKRDDCLYETCLAATSATLDDVMSLYIKSRLSISSHVSPYETCLAATSATLVDVQPNSW